MNTNRSPKVAVLGEGAWGTAIALLLADNGCNVTLWCYDSVIAGHIKNTCYNERYLPGVSFNTAIGITTELSDALWDSEWVFETTPVQFLRSVLVKAKPFATTRQTWVALSKGIEEQTFLLPTQIIKDVLGSDTKVAVCMGPSFAKQLAQKHITAIDCGGIDLEITDALSAMLVNTYFRPYRTTDVIGVQVGAAFKNVIALGIGMLDGADYTDNTKAFMLTYGLQEIMAIAIAMGGHPETLYGLSGVGDLVLTCMSSLSKNMVVGRRLGKGEKLDCILRDTGYIPEGINTVKSVPHIIKMYAVELPLCQSIYDVVNGKISIQTMMTLLIKGPLMSDSTAVVHEPNSKNNTKE